MSPRVTKSFNIILDNNKIEQYESLLSNFSDWKHFKRDIKLNSLLDNKKIQIDIDISSHAVGALYVSISEDEDYASDLILLRKACCSIESMKFVIKDRDVLNLEIKLKTLSTYYGKIVKNLLEENIDLELKQYLVDGQVKSFFFSLHKMVA